MIPPGPGDGAKTYGRREARDLVMPRAKLLDVLECWGHTWTHTKGWRGWIGPAIAEPPELAWAVECQHIVRQDGSYVMLDPWITLNRFGWGRATSPSPTRAMTRRPAMSEVPWTTMLARFGMLTGAP
jgi:hypothetical protein